MLEERYDGQQVVYSANLSWKSFYIYKLMQYSGQK